MSQKAHQVVHRSDALGKGGIEDLTTRFSKVKEMADKVKETLVQVHTKEQAVKNQDDLKETLDQIKGAEGILEESEAGLAAIKDRMMEVVEAEEKLQKILLPRRYHTPSGYLTPTFAIQRVAVSVNGLVNRYKDNYQTKEATTACTLVYSADQFAVSKSPVYFVSRELLKAVMHCDLPADMKVNEIQWPVKGMLFMLPHGVFSIKNYAVDFLLLSYVDDKVTPSAIFPQPYQPSPGSAMSVHAVLVSKDKADGLLQAVVEGEKSVGDFTSIHEVTRFNTTHAQDQMLNDDEICKYTDLVTSMALKILLVMQARPELVELGSGMMRPERVKRDRVVREALWHPNFIGRTYRRNRENIPHGNKSSEGLIRPHIRRGHWRKQRWGKELSLVKVIWIETVWVNMEFEEDEDGKD